MWGSRSRKSPKFDGSQLSETFTTTGRSASHWKSFNWEAEHGLQFVALKIMHDQAMSDLHDVPFDPLGSNIEDASVSFSGALTGYYNEIKDYPHEAEGTTELSIRRKYTHMSVQNSIGLAPEPNGTRRDSRM